MLIKQDGPYRLNKHTPNPPFDGLPFYVSINPNKTSLMDCDYIMRDGSRCFCCNRNSSLYKPHPDGGWFATEEEAAAAIALHKEQNNG